MWPTCTSVDQRRPGGLQRGVGVGGRSLGATSNCELREAPACSWEGLLAGERCVFFPQNSIVWKEGLFSLV